MTRTAIHPGEHLKDELEERALSASMLAHALNVPTNRVTEIINGERAVTAETAIMLAGYFKTSPEFWMNLQTTYDLRLAQNRLSEPRVKAHISDLYTYVMKHDTGLAPNPFWGACTLAVCTPNHQGSRAKPGDWIAGVSDKGHGYRIIYVMEVDERIRMDDYFLDGRFAAKKPIIDGTAQEQCGDNFYSKDERGLWIQHPNRYHSGSDFLAKDTRHPWVFVATRFWYLGRAAVDMPKEFLPMFGGKGTRVNHPPQLVTVFKAWVEKALQEGLNALPRDFEGNGCCPTPAGPMLRQGKAVRAC